MAGRREKRHWASFVVAVIAVLVASRRMWVVEEERAKERRATWPKTLRDIVVKARREAASHGMTR